jgi:hypothetical protein
MKIESTIVNYYRIALRLCDVIKEFDIVFRSNNYFLILSPIFLPQLNFDSQQNPFNNNDVHKM